MLNITLVPTLFADLAEVSTFFFVQFKSCFFPGPEREKDSVKIFFSWISQKSTKSCQFYITLRIDGFDNPATE